MRYLLLLAAFALASCSVIKKITGHTIKDQPVCDPGVEWVVPTGRILVTGDGQGGNDNWLDTLKHAVTTCPDCAVRVDAGDTYPTGVEDREDFEEKVLAGHRITPYPDFQTFGNHDMYSKDPNLLVEYTGKCDRFGLTDKETFWLYSINTNFMVKSQLDIAERYICDKPGLRVVLGHHPMKSADSKKRDEQEAVTKHHLHAMLKRCGAIYITGHAHHFEWSIIDGVPQILEGRLGRSLRKPIEDRPYIWATGEEYGYSILDPSDRSLKVYGVENGLLYETKIPHAE